MTIYATKHSQGHQISENGVVRTFETRAQAETWLLANTDFQHPRVVVGHFDSYWRRTDGPGPVEVSKAVAPFTLDQIETRGPDVHSLNFYGHKPTPEVLVLIDQPPAAA